MNRYLYNYVIYKYHVCDLKKKKIYVSYSFWSLKGVIWCDLMHLNIFRYIKYTK